jgi:hypothetical protein
MLVKIIVYLDFEQKNEKLLMCLRVSPVVLFILSLFVNYSATLYLFFQIHSPAALFIHSLLYLNIFFYSLFILLSHLNIIFFLFILYYYLPATITRITPTAITQILPTHRHHHHHHRESTQSNQNPS